MITNPQPGKTYKVCDGPREHPNGWLHVRVIRPATSAEKEVQTFYICELIGAAPSRTGRTLRVHYSSFESEA